MIVKRIWHKFHPIFENLLKVGFETTFPKEAVLNFNPICYEASNLIHNSPNETIKRIYEPAVNVFGLKSGIQVFFNPVLSTESSFRRLVFFRKIQKPYSLMVAARFGEESDFGFDSRNSYGNYDDMYLPLVYDGWFRPVYFKIQKQNNGTKEKPVYLEVCAWDDDQMVVVQAGCVEAKDVPKHLCGGVSW